MSVRPVRSQSSCGFPVLFSKKSTATDGLPLPAVAAAGERLLCQTTRPAPAAITSAAAVPIATMRDRFAVETCAGETAALDRAEADAAAAASAIGASAATAVRVTDVSRCR